MANNITTTAQDCGDGDPNNLTTLVSWIDDKILFVGVGETNTTTTVRTAIANVRNETVSVQLLPLPDWVTLQGGSPELPAGFLQGTASYAIPPFFWWGLEFDANFSTLQEGANYSEAIIFATWVNRTGCAGDDAVLVATAGVLVQERNQLSAALRGFIYFLFAVMALSCIFFMVWVYLKRNVRIVKAMQPFFLISMLFGLLLVSSAMIPLSIDDGFASQKQLDAACNVFPWLFSMGFSILFATIGVKLWRVNRIMRSSQSCRRVVLTFQDVLVPLLVLVIINFTLNLSKNIMDPVRYVRKPIDEEDPGVTFGQCEPGDEAVSEAANTLIGLINFGAFVFAAWQGCRARNVSDEFSESKRLGFGLFLWGQLLIIGIPILVILDDTEPAASLYLMVALIFGFCLSLIVALYIPIYFDVRKSQQRPAESGAAQFDRIRVTGLESETTVATAPPVDHIVTSGSVYQHQPQRSTNSLQETISSQTGRIYKLESKVEELEHLLDLYKQKHGELEKHSETGRECSEAEKENV